MIVTMSSPRFSSAYPRNPINPIDPVYQSSPGVFGACAAELTPAFSPPLTDAVESVTRNVDAVYRFGRRSR